MINFATFTKSENNCYNIFMCFTLRKKTTEAHTITKNSVVRININ